MSHFPDLLPHHHRRSTDGEGPTPPPGMTKEQLDFFTEQTERAVEKGVDRAERRWFKRAILGFTVFTVFSLANALYINQVGDDSRSAVVNSGNVVAVDGCNRDYVDREKFRSLLERLKGAAKASFEDGRTTVEQYEAATDFYDDQLEKYPSIDCRQAAIVLTDDPSARRFVPEPCFRGNPRNPEECAAPITATPTPAPKGKPR